MRLSCFGRPLHIAISVFRSYQVFMYFDKTSQVKQLFVEVAWGWLTWFDDVRKCQLTTTWNTTAKNPSIHPSINFLPFNLLGVVGRLKPVSGSSGMVESPWTSFQFSAGLTYKDAQPFMITFKAT